MARRRFVSGGEWQAPHWSDLEGVKVGAGTLDNVAAPAGRGPRAMLCADDAAVRCGSSAALDPAVEAMVYRAYFYVPALPSVEVVLIDPIGVGITLQARLRPDGRLAYLVDGAIESTPLVGAAPLATWFLLEALIELKTDTHPGMTAIRLDGQLAAPAREHDFESFDPHSEGPPDERADFGFRYVEEPIIVAGTEAYVTDIAIADSDAGADRRWTGTGRVEVLRPDGSSEASSARGITSDRLLNAWNAGTTYNVLEVSDGWYDDYAGTHGRSCQLASTPDPQPGEGEDRQDNLAGSLNNAPPTGVADARGHHAGDGVGSHVDDQVSSPQMISFNYAGGDSIEEESPGSPEFVPCTFRGAIAGHFENGTSIIGPSTAGEWFEVGLPAPSGECAFYQLALLAGRPIPLDGPSFWDGTGHWVFHFTDEAVPGAGDPGDLPRDALSSHGDFPDGWQPFLGNVQRRVTPGARVVHVERDVQSWDGISICGVGATIETDVSMEDPFPDLSSPPSTVVAGPVERGVRRRVRHVVGP